jgi:hypothetical protein
MRHLAKTNVPLYIRNKRAAKVASRLHRSWRAAIRSQKELETINAEFGVDSKIVSMMAHGTKRPSSKDALKGRVKFVAPEIFSLMDDAEGTLKAIKDLANQLLLPKVRSVRIDMNKVKSYDLGANALLDILVDETNTKAKRTHRKIKWMGSYPADSDQRRLVRSLGVIKFLEVSHEYNPPHEAAKVEAFHERCKHYIRAVRPNDTDRKSRVTQKFADHINNCLRRIHREMTHSARKKLCDYVGEILDNAEEHAQMYDWTIQGYLDTSADELICELVILNFGKSVADSLMALPDQGYTKTMIRPYLDAHKKKGLFSTGWDVGDLLTLIALQGGVSSKNFSVNDTRGNGTVDLISFFQKVVSECRSQLDGQGIAKMALVSGSTSILFDGKYEMASTAGSPSVIAFNIENDLLRLPDPSCIRHFAKLAFPGTILSIKFPLSSESSTLPLGDKKK